jgi:hypothetical protein
LVTEEGVFRRHVEPHVDSYISYCPRTFVDECPAQKHAVEDLSHWLSQHPARSQLGNFKASWSRIGFLLWKPLLIQRVLDSRRLEEGDILLYHDVNCSTYPSYLQGIGQWRSLSRSILDPLGFDFYVPPGMPLKNDAKAFLIRRYLNAEDFSKTGLWAGLMLFRKSGVSAAFLQEWCALCSDLDNLTPLPNPEPHPDFIVHSNEQAVAGVLAEVWRKKGLLPARWPRFELINRTYSRSAVVDWGRIGVRSTTLYLRRWIGKLLRRTKRT